MTLSILASFAGVSAIALAALSPFARRGRGRRRILGTAVVAGATALWLGFGPGLPDRWSSAGTTLAMGTTAYAATSTALPGPLGSLLGAPQWLNSPPLRAEDLRGKVVLVNFWTYSCINCLRVLPYVRAWAEAYRDRGLVVIGVHTPEFAFEKNVGNVTKAAASLGVGYPVVIDNDFKLWRAFDNEAWPALYFIGADGRVRGRALGEGGYDQSEKLIQQLLSEAGDAPMPDTTATIAAAGPQVAPDEQDLGSGETYVGYDQARGFASPGGVTADAPSLYRGVSALPLNRWSLAGLWTVGGEFATLNEASGRIAYRFHARDLHLVLAPPSPGQSVRFRVTIDGAAPGADHGSDIDAEGWGTVRDDRLYQLVRQAGPVADRTFEIEFLDPGVRAYVFTFG
jgi:thiol-disulfide isomerase/thioredoxin